MEQLRVQGRWPGFFQSVSSLAEVGWEVARLLLPEVLQILAGPQQEGPVQVVMKPQWRVVPGGQALSLGKEMCRGMI